MSYEMDLEWTGNKFLDFMITIFVVLLFVLLASLVIKGIIGIIAPSPPAQTDFSFMLIPYLRLPFIFWLFSGIGLCGGLVFNGFRLITVTSSTDSHNVTNKEKTDKKKK